MANVDPKVSTDTEGATPGLSMASTVYKLAFKAPAFWGDDPAMWFGQVESQFLVSGITQDSTKFHSVVSALDTKVLKCVRDIILNPPTANAYETLKTRILAFYEQSESSKLKLLLSDLHLGDNRPSQLLCEMESLNDHKLNVEALKALWMQRLPSNIQQILSVVSDDISDLSKLAKVADKVFEGSGNSFPNSVSAVDRGSSEIQLLRQEIEKLKIAIQGIENPNSSVDGKRFRKRNFHRNRSRSPSASRQQDWCWYHRRFKERATKCTKPCKWSGNAQACL